MRYSTYLRVVEILGPPARTIVTNMKTHKTGEEEIKEIEAWWPPIFDRVLEDCVYGNHKGCIDRVLLNRLECNMRYVKHRLNVLSYFPYFYNNAAFPWDRIHYYKQNSMNGIEQSIKNMQKDFAKYPGMSEIILSQADRAIDFNQINLLEYSLYDLNYLIDVLYANALYSDTCYVGEFLTGWE